MRLLGKKELFSVSELADLLGVPKHIVRELTEKLPGAQLRLGQNVFITTNGVRAAFHFNDDEYAHLVRMARENEAAAA